MSEPVVKTAVAVRKKYNRPGQGLVILKPENANKPVGHDFVKVNVTSTDGGPWVEKGETYEEAELPRGDVQALARMARDKQDQLQKLIETAFSKYPQTAEAALTKYAVRFTDEEAVAGMDVGSPFAETTMPAKANIKDVGVIVDDSADSEIDI